MRIRQLFFSTALCSGLILSSAAMAANDSGGTVRALQPDTNWSVSKIAGAKKSGDYCAMARRFGDGTILTMARNAASESSIALDLPENTLDKDANYKVTMRPENGTEKAFDVHPVSTRAMVIRLGQDEDFYQAMSRSGYLEIAFDGETYGFNIPDFEHGRNDLDMCVTALNGVAPGEGTAIVTPMPAEAAAASGDIAQEVSAAVPAPVRPAAEDLLDASAQPVALIAPPVPQTAEVQDIEPAAGEKGEAAAAFMESGEMAARNEAGMVSAAADAAPVSASAGTVISAASDDTENLREENLRLRSALEHERREYEDRYSRQDSGSSQVAELNEKIRMLEAENKGLQSGVSGAVGAVAPSCLPAESISSAVPALDDAAMKELSFLRDENVQLKGQIESLRLAAADTEKTVAAADGSNEESNTAIMTLQSRVDALEAEKGRLQDALKTAQAAGVSEPGTVTVSQLRSLQEQLTIAQADRDKFAAELDKIHTAGEDSLLSVSSSNWNLEQATRRYNEAEREIRRLGLQIEQQNNMCAAEKKEIEYKLFDPAIATKEQIAKLMTLEDQAAQAQAELDTQKSGYEAQISELSQKLESKDSEVEAARRAGEVAAAADVQMKVGEKDGQIAALQARIATMEADTEKLRVAMEAPRAAPADLARLGSERDQLAQQVTRLEEEKSSLMQKLSDIPTAAGGPVATVSTRDNAAAAYEQYEAASVPAPLAPVSQAQVVSAPVAVMDGGPLMTAAGLRDLLAGAGLPIKGDVAKVDNVSRPGFVAFSWESGEVFGSAEQQPVAGTPGFDSLVQQYLDKTKGRCSGDFAAVPGPVQEKGGVKTASYEIACIGQTGSASASLLFFSKDGLFTSVAHETAVEGMDTAMDMRDRLAAALVPAKMAAN